MRCVRDGDVKQQKSSYAGATQCTLRTLNGQTVTDVRPTRSTTHAHTPARTRAIQWRCTEEVYRVAECMVRTTSWRRRRADETHAASVHVTRDMFTINTRSCCVEDVCLSCRSLALNSIDTARTADLQSECRALWRSEDTSQKTFKLSQAQNASRTFH